MKDRNFIRTDKVPMTKEEVRCVSLSYLDIHNKNTMLDIGAGSGSCFIEALTQNKDLQATAIEYNENAISTINKNIEKFEKIYGNIKNRVTLIQEKAPCELNKKFDAIFVGGTSGDLENIIDWCISLLNDDGILVFNFITLENFTSALQILEKRSDITYIDGCQLLVNKIENLAKYKYLKPNNPVFIIKCSK